MTTPKNTAYTLEEIAKKLNISKERVRQIETQAIKKLRHPKISKGLHDYMKI